MSGELEYMFDAIIAFAEKRYEDVLSILNEGIDRNLTATAKPSSEEILESLKIMIAGIEKSIEIDFGFSFRKYTESVEKPKIICGFCGKAEKDVRIILSGFNARICNECLEVCKKFLTDNEEKL